LELDVNGYSVEEINLIRQELHAEDYDTTFFEAKPADGYDVYGEPEKLVISW
jgi:hypothetical protein